jgi:hypothetical protein
MRDYFTHTELTGRDVGGCGGIFPNVAGMMRDFVAQYQGNARFTDQYFRRRCCGLLCGKVFLAMMIFLVFIMPSPGLRIHPFAGRQNISMWGATPGLR